MTRRFGFTALVLVSLGLTPPAAAQTSRCSFGGPAPGFKAVRLDLPSGSSFLNTEITGSRMPRGMNVGRDSWHLAQGVVVLRKDAGGPASIAGYRVRSEGSSPTGVTVRRAGSDIASMSDGAGPDVPFTHSWALSVSSLTPGTYYAVAWGAGGTDTGPRDTWGAAVEVEGAHTCGAVGEGELFDLEQNDFSGGTQMTAPGFAHMDEATLAPPNWTDRSVVVGMIDAAVQGAGTGEARVEYVTPFGAGNADREVEAFTGGPGPYRFTAHVTGLFPVVSITGVRIDLP